MKAPPHQCGYTLELAWLLWPALLSVLLGPVLRTVPISAKTAAEIGFRPCKTAGDVSPLYLFDPWAQGSPMFKTICT